MHALTTTKSSTKVGTERHVSVVTIDWEGVTAEQAQAAAAYKMVNWRQTTDREEGVVPAAAYTIKAADYFGKVRAPRAKMTPAEAARLLSVEEIEALLADMKARAASAGVIAPTPR